MSRDTATPGRLAMPRRRGAASGLLIVVLGAWCAVIPLVGPLFNLTIGADNAFDFTTGRFWLSLLPGVVAAVGGLMLMQSRNRASATLGAQIALAAGIWLVVGPTVSMLWNSGTPQTGAAAGGTNRQVLELLLYFYGTGAAIAALSGIALGRVSSRHEGDVERLTARAERDREREHQYELERAERERAAETQRAPAAAPAPAAAAPAEEDRADDAGRFTRRRRNEDAVRDDADERVASTPPPAAPRTD